MNRPIVLVTARQTTRKDRLIDFIGEVHLELLASLGTLPVLVPVSPSAPDCLPQYMEMMDGLLLAEGDDIDPKGFAARKSNFQFVEKTHPLKDEIEVRLLRHALLHKLPILGICRGSQLMNVACGGTLYGDVQKEKRSQRPHIDYRNYDGYRHPVSILADTPLAQWYRRKKLNVNSYHHQGIRKLAPRLRPMALADDGLVEAYYDPEMDFMVGLQFHPERMLPEYPGNIKVWKAFTTAVQRSKAARDADSHSDVKS